MFTTSDEPWLEHRRRDSLDLEKLHTLVPALKSEADLKRAHNRGFPRPKYGPRTWSRAKVEEWRNRVASLRLGATAVVLPSKLTRTAITTCFDWTPAQCEAALLLGFPDPCSQRIRMKNGITVGAEPLWRVNDVRNWEEDIRALSVTDVRPLL